MTTDKGSPRPEPKPEYEIENSVLMARAETGFIRLAAVVYAAAALAMVSISVGLITVSFLRVYDAFRHHNNAESALLEAVSSLVISVAILDVAKYVMEEEVLHSRELRNPSEAREAVTKFMVIIALVVAIEGIVLVFELGNSKPELLLYPIFLLAMSVIIVVGLGVFQRLSLQAEERLADAKGDPETR
ncbi:hypothetical protein [Sulfitobacter sp. JL08]|uniref:hypothetical protein n=1 Tax=Sulfitobacter sp. JL08 TaxID=2070369 RepID=UPI0013B4603F|nr:hypothetical protein [Sulfitobacter sp. JL08]